MYELKKKNEKVFTSKFVGTGPSSYEKRIYRAAASQRFARFVWLPIQTCAILYTIHVNGHTDLCHTLHNSWDWPYRPVPYFTRFVWLAMQTCAILYTIHVTGHADLCHTLHDSCDCPCRPVPYFTRFTWLAIQTCTILYTIHVTGNADLCHTVQHHELRGKNKNNSKHTIKKHRTVDI